MKKLTPKNKKFESRINKAWISADCTHYHSFARDGNNQYTGSTTDYDGYHTHLFIIDGMPIVTDHNNIPWSDYEDHSVKREGYHTHGLDFTNSITLKEDSIHEHLIMVNGKVYKTTNGSPHTHEITNEGWFSNSGNHVHKLELDDGSNYMSLLPGDLLQQQIRKRVNLEVQSITVSSSFLSTVEEAMAYLSDRDFLTRDYEINDDGFKFKQLSRDRFKEETLKEIELYSGVKAIIGVLDPDKMNDANATFDMILDIDPSEEVLEQEQIVALANLQDMYAKMITDMKDKSEAFILVLNQFNELAEEYMKSEAFLDFLGMFVDSFNVINQEIEKIDTSSVEKTEDVVTTKNIQTLNFEDHLRSLMPVYKNLADVFVDSEDFSNLGRLLLHGFAITKKMILSLPTIREFGNGTPIEKYYNSIIDLENSDADEFESITKNSIKTMKIKPIEILKLKENENVNTVLKSILGKLCSNGEVKIDLGGNHSKDDGYIRIDKIDKNNVDLCYDIETGIPLPIDSVDIIKCKNVLQFISNDNRDLVVEEISRVLKNNGTIEISVPSTQGENAFLPCNKSFWNEKVFKYYAEKEDSPFEIVEISTKKDDDDVNSATVNVILKRKVR